MQHIEFFCQTKLTIKNHAILTNIYWGVVGLLVATVQGGLIRVINPKPENEKSVYVGLLLYAIGLLLFAFASQSWMMFVFLIPYCMRGIAGPLMMTGCFPILQNPELPFLWFFY